MKQYLNPRIAVVIGLLALAAASRFVPHPQNFTPILAIALFGGAMFKNRLLAFALPLTAMFVSDIFLGFHSYLPAVYLGFFFAVLLGFLLRDKIHPGRILAASLAGSIIFFVLTNFAVWLVSGMYPANFAGLTECYVAAIPFFRNAVIGDVVYTGVVFGAFSLVERFVPAVATA